jgi:MULE transposase domain
VLLFDWLLVIDGTFNINKDRLPLLIVVGVLNSGKTFPVCFSYYLSESTEAFALYGTRSKKNASNLTEICLLFPISVSSSVAKLFFSFEDVP